MRGLPISAPFVAVVKENSKDPAKGFPILAQQQIGVPPSSSGGK